MREYIDLRSSEKKKGNILKYKAVYKHAGTCTYYHNLDGDVVICGSSTLEQIGGVEFTICTGSTTTTVSTLTQAPTPTATTYNATFQGSACEGVAPSLSGKSITSACELGRDRLPPQLGRAQ
ncbi:hypothetical protein BPAE_0388g00040 [Botrytis paeoniae]|uniref:Uncharacterized protein n=1 Tax=Botrytis paeoniae TaxID=278948 RepID=A0A4Z1F3N3_9HELO|nr:hypothetical protein BPAE_0388g00040 [Botrytis paeoniae]